jgi:hypothetical protein
VTWDATGQESSNYLNPATAVLLTGS